jgi:hypothetical protein
MITNIELTETGTTKFNIFFAAAAKEGVSMQAVMFELLDILADRASMGESLSYELGSQYTITGRPEILRLDASDVAVTEESDE